MLFDGLSNYEAGRCADCTEHRTALGLSGVRVECRSCKYQASTDAYLPPMIGSADLSYLPRLESARVTAEWRTRSARKLDTGRMPMDESPIFGGRKQQELF